MIICQPSTHQLSKNKRITFQFEKNCEEKSCEIYHISDERVECKTSFKLKSVNFQTIFIIVLVKKKK